MLDQIGKELLKRVNQKKQEKEMFTLKTNIPRLAWQKKKDDRVPSKENANLKIEVVKKNGNEIGQRDRSDRSADQVDFDERPDQLKFKKTPQFTITADNLKKSNDNSPQFKRHDNQYLSNTMSRPKIQNQHQGSFRSVQNDRAQTLNSPTMVDDASPLIQQNAGRQGNQFNN